MSKTLKNALLVFAGGCCYGIVVPMVRFAHALGYSSTDIMAIQYIVSVLVLGVMFFFFPRGTVTGKQVFQLIGTGTLAAGVSFGYYHALALLSSAAALTLLFQFVWMGVVLQAILERRLPEPLMVVAVLLVLGGTVLAAGLLEWSVETLNPLGVFYGLLSALFYTAFLHFSARVATNLPTAKRSLFCSVGSLLVAVSVAPGFFSSGVLFRESSWIGVLLAIVGIVMPVLLIQKAAPKLPAGVTTIMASSELPSGVLMGALFAGDMVSAPELLGVVIILGGIVLSQAKALRKLGKSETPSNPLSD